MYAHEIDIFIYTVYTTILEGRSRVSCSPKPQKEHILFSSPLHFKGDTDGERVKKKEQVRSGGLRLDR